MEYNAEDNVMVSVSRENFKLVVNSHKEWMSNPVEGNELSIMQYVQGSKVMAQALYYKSGNVYYNVRKELIHFED